jgi:AcrR family transcriptional regulator
VATVLSVSNKSKSSETRGSREKILRVAYKEFSQKGLSGARVDRIAHQAKTSKNMIYYHFGSKDGLYREVMRQSYVRHRIAERDAKIDVSDPVAALAALVARSFDYLCHNEMFVRLVMNENMNHAKHLKDFSDLKADNQEIIETLDAILQAGKSRGLFREEIEPVEMHMTISALGFHYVSNRYTFSVLFDLDMKSEEAFTKRRDEVIDVVLRWCCVQPPS